MFNPCPECGIELYKKKSCNCGWRARITKNVNYNYQSKSCGVCNNGLVSVTHHGDYDLKGNLTGKTVSVRCQCGLGDNLDHAITLHQPDRKIFERKKPNENNQN